MLANAPADPGGGTIIIVWPRSATARREGNGTTVVIWPRAAGSGAPVRVGQPIELVGDMKDDVSGPALHRPLPPGCSGRAFVASEFRPAPPR